jgi:peroxiredoxin Q/BCP
LLLSDEEGKVHELFKDKETKKLLGNGVGRSTFVFNKEGKLIKEFRGVKVNGHPEEVLDFIKSI